MIYFPNIRRSGGMVDTKDSKSFVSDGVRVQVSSPVSKNFLYWGSSFYLTTFTVWDRLELDSLDKSRSVPNIDESKMTAVALIF